MCVCVCVCVCVRGKNDSYCLIRIVGSEYNEHEYVYCLFKKKFIISGSTQTINCVKKFPV